MKRGLFAPGALCCTPISTTTARSDSRSAAQPLPGVAGYRRASLPAAHSGGAETGLPCFQDGHPHVQRPIRRRVPRRPLPDPGRLPWPSPSHDRLGSLLARPWAGPLDDACSGFTRVADRAVASAPLRTRPLDHARGHHYQGPRHLPEPDSHRQAALNLSLLHHADLLFLMAPEQSRRTRRMRERAHPGGPAADPCDRRLVARPPRP
jgi:hypothetical protein